MDIDDGCCLQAGRVVELAFKCINIFAGGRHGAEDGIVLKSLGLDLRDPECTIPRARHGEVCVRFQVWGCEIRFSLKMDVCSGSFRFVRSKTFSSKDDTVLRVVC